MELLKKSIFKRSLFIKKGIIIIFREIIIFVYLRK